MLLLIMSLITGFIDPPSNWGQLPSLPDTEGVAGSFAGESHSQILIAGGANFPNAKPWEGGVKSWYADVYVLDPTKEKCLVVGKLERPLGYGVSGSFCNRLICAGGSDRENHYADVFSLEYKDGRLTQKSLPSLPQTLANASGMMVGTHLYVVGGQELPTSTKASNQVWSLNLAQPKTRWVEESALPGPARILCSVGSYEEKLYVFGGVELFEEQGKVKRRYLNDAYVLEPKKGWRRLADIPEPLAASATPTPSWKGKLYLVGGDNGSQVGKFSTEHTGFSNKIWCFDTMTETWTQDGNTPAPRVTLPLVQSNSEVYFLSGEKTPGVRSAENWLWKLE